MKLSDIDSMIELYLQAERDVLAGKKAEPTDAITFDQAVEQARALVEKGASVNAAAKEIAAVTPYKKGDLYKALL